MRNRGVFQIYIKLKGLFLPFCVGNSDLLEVSLLQDFFPDKYFEKLDVMPRILKKILS